VNKNGAAVATLVQQTVANDNSVAGSIIAILAAGDYLELTISVAANATLQSSVSDTSPCYFSVDRLGA